jgi:hypothetical protein
MSLRIYPAPKIPVSMPTISEDDALQALGLYPKNGIGRVPQEVFIRHYKGCDLKLRPVTGLSREQIRRFSTERILRF